MHITINTEVLCDGKYCGRSTYLIVSLVNERVTQPVGAKKRIPQRTQFLHNYFVFSLQRSI